MSLGCSHLQAVLGSPPGSGGCVGALHPQTVQGWSLTETSFTSWVHGKSTSSAACPLLVLFLQRGG